MPAPDYEYVQTCLVLKVEGVTGVFFKCVVSMMNLFLRQDSYYSQGKRYAVTEKSLDTTPKT